MPKVGQTGLDFKDEYFDTNGPEPKDGYSIQAIFEMYGFVGVNRTRWNPGDNFPELVVRYLDFDSLSSSPASVEAYLEREYRKQTRPNGFIAKLTVTLAEVASGKITG